MDENDFFKQATLRICSSLDIETALFRALQFIAEVLPADWAFLNIYDPTLGGLQYVAMATSTRGTRLKQVIPLPDRLIHDIETGRRLQNHLIINNPQQDPIGKIVIKEFSLPTCSSIAQRLLIEGHRLGVLDIFARGSNRYNTEHAHLISLLQDPFGIAMANALKHQELIEIKDRLVSDNHYLHQELLFHSGGSEVIGANTGLSEVMHQVRQIAPLNNTILLLGETGTGKEVIANAIHRLSPRHEGPFIKVNCGAIPESLIDSELFGYEKGAFTGAIQQHRGRFERADGGTIFLDEIGELPPWAQIRLLRVLQTREIERIGGSPPVRLNIRVLAATHRDLLLMVRQGSFREDLWFRINGFPIRIPALHERKEDIPLLAASFIEKKSREFGIHPPPALPEDAIQRLLDHPWPGNVRELENVVERAIIQHRHGNVSLEQIIKASLCPQPLKSPQSSFPCQTLDEITKSHIEQVLWSCQGKVNGPDGAAALLDIHPNTLRNRMRKLGISFGRAAISKAPDKYLSS